MGVQWHQWTLWIALGNLGRHSCPVMIWGIPVSNSRTSTWSYLKCGSLLDSDLIKGFKWFQTQGRNRMAESIEQHCWLLINSQHRKDIAVLQVNGCMLFEWDYTSRLNGDLFLCLSIHPAWWIGHRNDLTFLGGGGPRSAHLGRWTPLLSAPAASTAADAGDTKPCQADAFSGSRVKGTCGIYCTMWCQLVECGLWQ